LEQATTEKTRIITRSSAEMRLIMISFQVKTF